MAEEYIFALKVRKIIIQKILTRKIYFILYSVPSDNYYVNQKNGLISFLAVTILQVQLFVYFDITCFAVNVNYVTIML